jgi:release factor glutamine methyltransferase
VESPRFSAEWLLADALGVRRLDLYLRFQEEIPPQVLESLRRPVRRRAAGEPLQYVQGFAFFRGERFAVTHSTFIPRPETEILFEEVLPLLDPEGPPILDVGTGCGVLAISLARALPRVRVLGGDKSPEALEVARQNAGALPNLELLRCDLLEGVPQLFYQAILANLPYIPTGLLARLPREVQWEPRLALDGGPDGMHYIRALAEQSRNRCRWLALEIGDGQSEVVQSYLQELGYTVTKVAHDLRGIPRVVIAQGHA